MSNGLESEDPDWLQPGVLRNDEDMGSSLSNQRMGAVVFIVIGIASFVLLGIIAIREYYWRKYGMDICPRGVCARRQPPDPSLEADRVLAETLQRQLNEEGREVEREAKRKERRIWYESYIKDFTMTANEKDLYYAHELHEPSIDIEQPPETEKKQFTEKRLLKKISTVSEISDEEFDSAELDETCKSICPPVACDAYDEDAHLYLRLPVKDEGGNFRTVDAHCAICFSEYEGGDKVVYSGLQCRHAFHDECILPWLSKGKKRCPICRHWFVPGARIEDQKRELEERLRSEANAAGSSETSDETDDSERDLEEQTQESTVHTTTGIEIPAGSQDELPVSRTETQTATETLTDPITVQAANDEGNATESCTEMQKDSSIREVRLESEEWSSSSSSNV